MGKQKRKPRVKTIVGQWPRVYRIHTMMTDHSHGFLTKSYDNKWFCKNKNIFFYLISVKLLGPLAYFRINFSRKRLKVFYLVFKLSNASEAICRFFLWQLTLLSLIHILWVRQTLMAGSEVKVLWIHMHTGKKFRFTFIFIYTWKKVTIYWFNRVKVS